MPIVKKKAKEATGATPVHNVNPALHGLLVPIAGLQEDPKNVRKHDERNVKAIADSLSRFSQQKPIVLHPNGKYVVAGSGTLRAARQLGWTHLAAVPFSGDAGKLLRGYKVADNRTAELAEWDWEVLLPELQYLTDAGVGVGWSGDELSALFKSSDWQAEVGEFVDAPYDKAKVAGKVFSLTIKDSPQAVAFLAELRSLLKKFSDIVFSDPTL